MTLTNFNGLDYAFAGVFVLLILLSIWRGLIKEVISVIAWLSGLVAAFTFAPRLAALFTSSESQATLTSAGSAASAGHSSFTLGLCFVVILVAALIIGAIINYFVAILVQASGLSIFNRFLGGVFGFAKAFIIGIAVVFFVQMTAYAKSPLWEQSEFVNAYQPVLAALIDRFGSDIDDIKTKITKMETPQARP